MDTTLHYRFTDAGLEFRENGKTIFVTCEQLRDIYEESIVHNLRLAGRLANNVFEQGKKVEEKV